MAGLSLSALDSLSGLESLDRRFARFVAELDPAPTPELVLASALVSARVGEGHVCLDLPAFADAASSADLGVAPDWALPPLGRWIEVLRGSPVVGEPGEFRPLILDPAGRLYLYRYWRYERAVADYVRSRASLDPEPVDRRALDRVLHRLFPDPPTDWQRVAGLAALRRRFLIISGGPGTGKTTTSVRILALLAEQPGGDSLRIVLAAPTGKAAARLKEAVRVAKGHLSVTPASAARIPEDVSTLHRLLGAIPNSSRFVRGPENPIAADVVVVDEASMVDLPLLAKLVAALPARARLILIGDRDQLASVEAGAVLGDLCSNPAAGSCSPEMAAFLREASGDEVPIAQGGVGLTGLLDSIVLLRENYRFGAESGIGKASRAVNAGDGAGALAVLHGGRADASWISIGGERGGPRDLAERLLAGYAGAVTAATPEEAFARFRRFQVLCALRRGPFGVEGVNELAERELASRGLIHPNGRWYRGRPVMVTANDHGLKLYNGDVGITLPDPGAGGELRVFFAAPDGSLRSLAPSRLPPHETCFAVTVHKSQGSEFEEVLLLLGAQPSRVLSRELVYTALTRARRRAEVWGTEAAFLAAVSRRVVRSSGLREALWG